MKRPTVPTSNPFARRAKQQTVVTTPVPQAATQPISLNPLFGRPSWTYVNLVKAPVTGPSPRLAVGTGRTGNPALPGNSPQLPGYLSDVSYFPTMFDYNPITRESNAIDIPRTFGQGENGRQLVSTYEPHDFAPAKRFFLQYRSAYGWQVQSFPPANRALLQWQQVQKYDLTTAVARARPLPSNNYFLGYQIDPNIQAQIGQTGNGVL